MTTPPKSQPAHPEGERIAKVLSRAGVASRREAERMIELGQVGVNGRVIESPALNVTAKDRITVDGRPVAAPEPARLWLYYKPEGLVTSAADEKGRATIFDHLPDTLPRTMPVGRLDLNSEGLLLLTNDGGLKRKLELPSTGWLRKYRVRIKGRPDDATLDPLRRGLVIDGENFLPMSVTLDRVQGANAWLTVGLREGRNREIRRAMFAVGMEVNRLIRISYGPFRLGDLKPGDVEEVKGRVLRDQLGQRETPEDAPEASDRAKGPRVSRATDPRPTAGTESHTRRIAARAPAPQTPSASHRIPGAGDGVPTVERAAKSSKSASAFRNSGSGPTASDATPGRTSSSDAARPKPASRAGWAKAAAPREKGKPRPPRKP